MLPMIPNRPQPYEDELSAIEVALASLETQVASVNDTLSNLNISTTSQNEISVGGGGATLWQGSLSASESITIANNLNFVRISSTIVKSGSSVYGYGDGGIARGQNFQIDSVAFSLASNGDFTITAPGTNSFDVWVSFISDPLMAGGIVGPRGATGETGGIGPAGADGEAWGGWSNITLNSNVELKFSGPARYRVSPQSGFVQASIGPVTSWSGTVTLATLPAEARPSSYIRSSVTVGGGGTATPYLITLAQSGDLDIYNTNFDSTKSLRLLLYYPLD